MKKKSRSVKCASCERTVPKAVAYEKDGEFYCCPDCAQGKTCDCQ